jgi:hypothetical protein
MPSKVTKVGDGSTSPREIASKAGLYKLNPVDPDVLKSLCSLKAPGFLN